MGTEATKKVELVADEESSTQAPEESSIQKPQEEFSLERFKSKRTASIANVETLHNELPVLRPAEVRDWFRLHPDEDNYWSCELCFVPVPIKGQRHDTVHLIDDELAALHLASGRVEHYRLALATKPYDVPFLCKVPTRNLDNSWNAAALDACTRAKTLWTQVSSRAKEGVEGYKIDFARDPKAFPEPEWPTDSLNKLIYRTYNGRMILTPNDPALLRLIGGTQQLS
jgi:hypothetical protein